MNSEEAAKYIKERILMKKYRDDIEGDTPSDTAWYRGYNIGLRSAGNMIDIIINNQELDNLKDNPSTPPNADAIIHKLMSDLYAELIDCKYKTSNHIPTYLISLACIDNVQGVICGSCKYRIDNKCILVKIKDLVKQVAEISNQKQYVVVAKSLLIYGPTTKEECEKVAKTLENVKIRELDSHEFDI